jgi:hypothetical protein
MNQSSAGFAPRLLLAALLAGGVALAQAQTSAPADTGDAIPPFNCTKPVLPNDKSDPNSMQTQIKHFNKDFPVYHDCIQAYVNERKAVMKHYTEQANKNAAAAQAAIDEINKVVADAKAFMPQDDDSDSDAGGTGAAPKNNTNTNMGGYGRGH